jgi:signal transduction histidine kinase/CheY-like chemotaxis protein
MTNFNILLIDDIESNLLSLEAIIEDKFSEEITIIKCLDVEEALKIVHEVKIDLILTDVQMPVMDGFQFAKFLNKFKRTSSIPLIFVTALSKETKYKKKGYITGGLDYITKPIDEEILTSKLENYIKIFTLQKQLIEADRKSYAILEAQKSMVFICDNTSTNYINKKFYDNFSFNHIEEFKSTHKCISELFVNKGDKISHLGYKDQQVKWQTYLSSSLNPINEAYLIDKDGKERVYEVTVGDKQYNNTEEIVILNEITLIKHQHNQIQKQSRFVAMGEMIAMIAHQWRQPLTAINLIMSKMHIKYNMGAYSSKDFDSDYNDVNKQIQYMTYTINDFRTFFKDNESIGSIKISNLIESSKLLISGLTKEYKIKLNINYDINPDFLISVSQSKINQVLLNLYKNSIDEFQRKGKEDKIININVSESNNCISIEVEDNAGGISNDIVDKIFDPYFSTKDEQHGTGIGLYMVKIIIETKFKGIIKFINNDIGGASFIISLPKNI